MLGFVGLPDLLKLCAGILLVSNAARERILNSALQGWSRSACGFYVEMGEFAGTNISCDEQGEATRQSQSRHLPPPHRNRTESSRCSWTAALPCMRSIPSSLSVCVTASASLAP